MVLLTENADDAVAPVGPIHTEDPSSKIKESPTTELSINFAILPAVPEISPGSIGSHPVDLY